MTGVAILVWTVHVIVGGGRLSSLTHLLATTTCHSSSWSLILQGVSNPHSGGRFPKSISSNSRAQECFKSVSISYQCPTGQGKSRGEKRTSEFDVLDMLFASQFS